MHKHLLRLLSRRNMSLIGFASACVLGSFLIGIRTAGDVQPFARSEAQQADILQDALPGDIDGNGIVSVEDAIALVKILQGTAPQTDQALLADPNHDGVLTLEDVLSILRSLPSL